MLRNTPCSREELPAAIPENARGRLIEPHLVVIRPHPMSRRSRQTCRSRAPGRNFPDCVSQQQSPRSADRSRSSPRRQRGIVRRRAALRNRCGFDRSAIGTKHLRVHAPQQERRQRKEHKARPDYARHVGKETEQQRREEAAKPAHRTDEAGDGTGICLGKYCGTSLNTAPFPKPSSAAQPSAPDGEGNHGRPREQQRERNDAEEHYRQHRAPPMRSASHPPIGRSNVARTTNPAVRNPASAAGEWNWSLSSVGK